MRLLIQQKDMIDDRVQKARRSPKLIRKEITVHGPTGVYQRMAWVLPSEATLPKPHSVQFDIFDDDVRSDKPVNEKPSMPQKLQEWLSEKRNPTQSDAARDWLLKNKYFGEDSVNHSMISGLLGELDKAGVLPEETKKKLIELQAKAMISSQYSSDRDKNDAQAMLEKVRKGEIDRSALMSAISDALFVLGEYDTSVTSKESAEEADIVAEAITKMVGKNNSVKSDAPKSDKKERASEGLSQFKPLAQNKQPPDEEKPVEIPKSSVVIDRRLKAKVDAHNAKQHYEGKTAEGLLVSNPSYRIEQIETDHNDEFNRRYFNRMSSNAEQDKYLERLARKKIESRLYTTERGWYEIPNYVYDYLAQKYPDRVKAKAENPIRKSIRYIFKNGFTKDFGRS